MINNLQTKKTEAKKVEKRKIIVFIIMLKKNTHSQRVEKKRIK